MSLFDLPFWKDFISNGLATLVGALIGIPIALWLDRRMSSRRRVEEQRQGLLAARARKPQFVDMLEEALRKNYQLVVQMKQELSPQLVICYNVDTLLLDATSSLKYDLIEDLALNRLLDSVRYELGHLHRKVELQLEIEFSAYRAMGGYQAKRTQLVGAIHSYLLRIEAELSEALTRLAAMRDRLAGNPDSGAARAS